MLLIYPLDLTTLLPLLCYQLSIMPLIGQERVVYYREQAALYYNPWAFGIVISLVELPYQIAQVGFTCGIQARIKRLS